MQLRGAKVNEMKSIPTRGLSGTVPSRLGSLLTWTECVPALLATNSHAIRTWFSDSMIEMVIPLWHLLGESLWNESLLFPNFPVLVLHLRQMIVKWRRVDDGKAWTERCKSKDSKLRINCVVCFPVYDFVDHSFVTILLTTNVMSTARSFLCIALDN